MREWLENPKHLRSIHFWGIIAWSLPATAVAWWIVYQVPEPHAAFAILLVSNYANLVGHWAAWQAVRSEQQAS